MSPRSLYTVGISDLAIARGRILLPHVEAFPASIHFSMKSIPGLSPTTLIGESHAKRHCLEAGRAECKSNAGTAREDV